MIETPKAGNILPAFGVSITYYKILVAILAKKDETKLKSNWDI